MHAVRFSQLLRAPFLTAVEMQIFVNNPRNWWPLDPSASRTISLTVRWLWGLSSWLSNSDSTVSTFSSLCALHLPLPGRLSTVPNFTSSLWMLFFVQPLSKYSVITTERCNLYIHTDYWSKFCLLYWTASKLVHLLDTASKLALFSTSDLKDEKLIKKANLHENWNMQTLFSRLLNISVKYRQNWSLKFRTILFQSWVVFWDTV